MSSKLQSDDWNQFIAGNVSCFKNIYMKYYKEMYGYGVKLSDRPELVEDCIQELFKDIWKRRGELTHVKSPNVYLFVSLRRKLLKHIERTKRYNGNLEEVDETSFIKFGMDEIITRGELKKEQKVELHKALNQLTDRQKEVVILYFYNGMSYNEIAKIMSINKQSIYNHMYRAMDTLRSILEVKISKLVIMLAVTIILCF